MKKRFLSLIILLFWLSSTFLTIVVHPVEAQTDWSFVSSDLDGDGLPNNIEEIGWCNAVGCFQTDPLDPDSDDDTLTDGEEKLIDSIPNNDASPGIYAVYEHTFDTEQYYPWQQYGHRLIARGDADSNNFVPPNPDAVDVQYDQGTDLDAIVVRRGTTFYVGGPVGATLQVTESTANGANLTDLTVSQNPHTGLWEVTVPPGGTVGKYTLTLDGNSIELFVIFELPTPSGELTQTGIEKFLYDGDKAALQDEQGIVLGDYANRKYPPEVPPAEAGTVPAGEWLAEGWAYTFQNQQFNRFILEEHVIDTINGLTDQTAAAEALTKKVDAETVFRNPRVIANSWKVLHPGSNIRQQCSNIAALLVAYNRSAGIPSRPLMTDWKNSSFDHATEIWVDNSWYAYRAYEKWEMGPEGDDTQLGCTTGWPACGSSSYKTRDWWGSRKYRPWHSGGNGSSNMIILANESWTNTPEPAYRWPTWNTSTWYAPGLDDDVLALGTSLVRRDWFETQNAKYWSFYGWTAEPTVTGTPPDDWPEGMILGGLGPSSSDELTPADFQSTGVQLGDVVAEYGVDTNGNGLYDQLVLEVEVTAAQPGRFWLRGQLTPVQLEDSLVRTGAIIADAFTSTDLIAGTQTVRLIFGGEEIALKRVDGPYLLNGLWITDVENPGPLEFMNDSLAYREQAYTTALYQTNQFENYGAVLTGQYSHTELDTDGNGEADALRVTTGIDLYQPSTYTVQGSLFNSQGQFVAVASWTGSGTGVTLQFDDLAGTSGPLTLRDLDLLDQSGISIDYIEEAYTIDPGSSLLGAGSVSIDIMPEGELAPAGVTITPINVFSSGIVDGNLKVEADVDVTTAGSYKIEAWLADDEGNLVTWASSQPTELSAGIRTLSVTFDGENIRANGIDGPYTVVALKILNGYGPYNVLDEVDVALTTQAYSSSQFGSTGFTKFEDFVAAPDSADDWSADPAWSISSQAFFSPSEAWKGAGSNGSLKLANPLDLSGLNRVGLRFETSYQLTGSTKGYVEGSTNGTDWTPLATFTGNAFWLAETRLIDLTSLAGQSTAYVRFRLESAGPGDIWYLDDILISGQNSNSTFLPIVIK